MAINRSTQQRQNYGLGSFVKKAFNKVTRPFTKIAQKIVPKEIAGIARMAAPFVAGAGNPGLGALISAAAQAKQRGRINPFETALAAAPGFAYGKGAYFGDEKKGFLDNLGIGSLENAADRSGAGSSLRNILTGGGEFGTRELGEGVIPGKFGTAIDSGLYGNFDEDTKGLLGNRDAEYNLLDNKIVDLAIMKKDGETLNPLKIGSWGMGIYSSIEAGKFKDEMEAAEAAEQALLAADATATEGDISEAREWAQTLFSKLSLADIGLAEGGRVNYAIGSNPLPSDPTAPVNPFKPKPIGPVLPNKEMADLYKIQQDMAEKTNKEKSTSYITGAAGIYTPSQELYEAVLEIVKEDDEANNYATLLLGSKEFKEGDLSPDQAYTMIINKYGKNNKAQGGLMRSNYALGTRPEPKESGLGGLPIEADMRYTGGFMPYGKKEKADDVPARLSKNEFVFTADAVKAAGGGSMNEGARKMYQTMKMLEQKNRMMS